ncbi:MAG: hypothetical protein ACLQVI_35145 [Polyangiaceae bacterium]
MPHFERELWQATTTFGPTTGIAPADAGGLLVEAQRLPLRDMQWQLPALMPSSAVQVEFGPQGVLPMRPDFLLGTSPRGWVVQLSARHLIVRHQELVADGRRSLAADDFPDRATFCGIVEQLLRVLPASLVAYRTSMLVEYAMFTAGIYPASLLGELVGRGRRVESPPPDGQPFLHTEQTVEFETSGATRHVWNDSLHVGNWFDPSGQLLQNAAVVRALEVKTAVPEPTHPLPDPPRLEAMRPIPRAEVLAFFAPEGPHGLRALMTRFQRSLPAGVECHE